MLLVSSQSGMLTVSLTQFDAMMIGARFVLSRLSMCDRSIGLGFVCDTVL